MPIVYICHEKKSLEYSLTLRISTCCSFTYAKVISVYVGYNVPKTIVVYDMLCSGL